jgi:hypothetical protein
VRVNGVISANGGKRQQQQDSEEEQESLESAKGSVCANSHHQVTSPPNGLYVFVPDFGWLYPALGIHLS